MASAIVAGTDLVAPTTDPIDIGSGQGTTIMELATMVAKRYGAPAPHVTGQFREGDVRSGVADIEAAKAVLAWRPAMSVERGIGRLCDWIDGSEQH
ncbi:dTDP-L-rhamnose 4-epimerase [compost metagenome]